MEKQAGRLHRSWRKLHFAITPDTGETLASGLTIMEEGDASSGGHFDRPDPGRCPYHLCGRYLRGRAGQPEPNRPETCRNQPKRPGLTVKICRDPRYTPLSTIHLRGVTTKPAV